MNLNKDDFTKAFENDIALKIVPLDQKLKAMAFQLKSWIHFLPKDERTIVMTEMQLMNLHVRQRKALADMLGKAMAAPIHDRLREASFARRIIPPRQV